MVAQGECMCRADVPARSSRHVHPIQQQSPLRLPLTRLPFGTLEGSAWDLLREWKADGRSSAAASRSVGPALDTLKVKERAQHQALAGLTILSRFTAAVPLLGLHKHALPAVLHPCWRSCSQMTLGQRRWNWNLVVRLPNRNWTNNSVALLRGDFTCFSGPVHGFSDHQQPQLAP